MSRYFVRRRPPRTCGCACGPVVLLWDAAQNWCLGTRQQVYIQIVLDIYQAHRGCREAKCWYTPVCRQSPLLQQSCIAGNKCDIYGQSWAACNAHPHRGSVCRSRNRKAWLAHFSSSRCENAQRQVYTPYRRAASPLL